MITLWGKYIIISVCYTQSLSILHYLNKEWILTELIKASNDINVSND